VIDAPLSQAARMRCTCRAMSCPWVRTARRRRGTYPGSACRHRKSVAVHGRRLCPGPDVSHERSAAVGDACGRFAQAAHEHRAARARRTARRATTSRFFDELPPEARSTGSRRQGFSGARP